MVETYRPCPFCGEPPSAARAATPAAPPEGTDRDALWARWTSGEKLAYGCGYRDGRGAATPAAPEALREALKGLVAAASLVIVAGVSNRSGAKYAQKVAAFDALDDALEVAGPLALDATPDPVAAEGLDEWMASVVSAWRKAWEGKDHRYGKDFAAFVGERLMTDFSLWDQEPYPFGHARLAKEAEG